MYAACCVKNVIGSPQGNGKSFWFTDFWTSRKEKECAIRDFLVSSLAPFSSKICLEKGLSIVEELEVRSGFFERHASGGSCLIPFVWMVQAC